MTAPATKEGFDRRLAVLLALVVLVLVFASRAPLVLDDQDELDFLAGLSSALLALKTDCYGLFRPVKNLVFLAYQSFGTAAPWIWRLLTAAVYLGATGLVVALARRLLARADAALLAGAIWALAPTQVAGVAWLSCFNILLQALFVFAALWMVDRSADPEPPRGARAMAWCCGFGAMLCYEAAVALPLLVGVWEAARGRGGDRTRLLRVVAPFAVVSVVFVVVRSVIGGKAAMVNESFAPSSDLTVMLGSAWFMLQHLGQWLWPFQGPALFGAYHAGALTPWWVLYASWAGVTLLVVAAGLLWRRAPWFSFGVAWYLFAFLPTSNILPVRSGPIADYFLVVPSFGLAVAFAARAMKPGRGGLVVVSLWRGAAVVLALLWALAWNEPARLYALVLKGRPDAFPMRANLAREHLLAGRHDEAIAEARKAAEQGPWYTLPLYVMGDALRERGDLAGARLQYEAVLQKSANAPYAHFALAFVLEGQGDLVGAESHYRAVIDQPWNPHTFDTTMNLGGLLAGQGRAAEAIVVLNKLLDQGTSNPDLHRNLAALYHQTGDTNGVLRHMQAYRALTEK